MVSRSPYTLKYQEKTSSNEQISISKIDISYSSKSFSGLKMTTRELTHLIQRGKKGSNGKDKKPIGSSIPFPH